MVVPWIYDAVAKSHVIWLNAKNCPFCIFSRYSPSCRRSDNIDASMPPHSSFETLWPILFMENIQNGKTFKIGGPSPLRSQLIQNRDTLKRCFSGLFFWKILVFSHYDQRKPPPSYTSLESCASWRFNHIARNTDHLTCKPSEFRGRSWTDFLDDPRLCLNHYVCGGLRPSTLLLNSCAKFCWKCSMIVRI